jgi:hypothetical protein
MTKILRRFAAMDALLFKEIFGEEPTSLLASGGFDRLRFLAGSLDALGINQVSEREQPLGRGRRRIAASRLTHAL